MLREPPGYAQYPVDLPLPSLLLHDTGGNHGPAYSGFLAFKAGADEKTCFLHLSGRIFSLLKTTRYGTLNLANLEEQPNPEKLSLQVLARIHHLTALHEPYSVASLNSYLYFKELEIHRIITIIESIRYGLGQQQILNRLENVM